MYWPEEKRMLIEQAWQVTFEPGLCLYRKKLRRRRRLMSRKRTRSHYPSWSFQKRLSVEGREGPYEESTLGLGEEQQLAQPEADSIQ